MVKSMKVHLGPRVEVRIYGGPYYEKPADMGGVRMAAELDIPADAVVPVRDFGVPGKTHYRALYGALLFALYGLSKGREVYVGCMGGVGRTGLFLALLARCLDVISPIAYVREQYSPRAVETPEQEAFVRDFDLAPLGPAIKGAIQRAERRRGIAIGLNVV